MTNLCRDEVTTVLKDKIESVFGGSFNTNGLGAVLTCGVTGIKAGLSHSPLSVVRGGGAAWRRGQPAPLRNLRSTVTWAWAPACLGARLCRPLGRSGLGCLGPRGAARRNAARGLTSCTPARPPPREPPVLLCWQPAALRGSRVCYRLGTAPTPTAPRAKPQRPSPLILTAPPITRPLGGRPRALRVLLLPPHRHQ
jgi:hypothetical protein